MSEVIVKVIVESGYFYTSAQEQHYPHRRAVWGNRIFVRGPSGINWDTEVLRFRDFLRNSQNHFTQITRMRYWVCELPLENKRESEQRWGRAVTLWDNGRNYWPVSGFNQTVFPYNQWNGLRYRGTGYAYYPLPPSIAYRYERLPSLPGRGQYGYLRCIEYNHIQASSRFQGERLPFCVHPSRLPVIHNQQITVPLQRSGMHTWHASTNPVREVMITHRRGLTEIIPVTGYAVGTVITTARNFSLPVV